MFVFNAVFSIIFKIKIVVKPEFFHISVQLAIDIFLSRQLFQYFPNLKLEAHQLNKQTKEKNI